MNDTSQEVIRTRKGVECESEGVSASRPRTGVPGAVGLEGRRSSPGSGTEAAFRCQVLVASVDHWPPSCWETPRKVTLETGLSEKPLTPFLFSQNLLLRAPYSTHPAVTGRRRHRHCAPSDGKRVARLGPARLPAVFPAKPGGGHGDLGLKAAEIHSHLSRSHSFLNNTH